MPSASTALMEPVKRPTRPPGIRRTSWRLILKKELDGQLDLLFAESLGCGPAIFLKASPNVQIGRMILSGPEYLDFGVLNRLILKVMPQKAISNGTRKVHACMGAALYGADGAGNADHAPPYPGSYQLGIRPGHLGGRTLSLSDGLSGTARCKGRLLVRRKRRAHEKRPSSGCGRHIRV